MFFFLFINFPLHKLMKFRINFQHLRLLDFTLKFDTSCFKKKGKNSEILAVRIILEMDSLVMDASLCEEKLTHVRT